METGGRSKSLVNICLFLVNVVMNGLDVLERVAPFASPIPSRLPSGK